jgi:hypothetical protein
MQEKTHENKILSHEHLRTLLEACPQRMLLTNNSKGMILPCTQFTFGQEIQANYNSKLSIRTIFDEKNLVKLGLHVIDLTL